jgi:hypothetical protein
LTDVKQQAGSRTVLSSNPQPADTTDDIRCLRAWLTHSSRNREVAQRARLAAERSAKAAREALSQAESSAEKSLQADKEAAHKGAEQARAAIHRAAAAAADAEKAARQAWEADMATPEDSARKN